MKTSLYFLALIALALSVSACSDQQRVYPSAPQGGQKKIVAAQAGTGTSTETSVQVNSSTETSTQTLTQTSTGTATDTTVSDLKDRPCQDLSGLTGTWTLDFKTDAESIKRVSILSQTKTKDGSLKYSGNETLTIKKPNKKAQTFRANSSYFYEPDRCVVTRTIGANIKWHKLISVKNAEKEFIVDYQVCGDISCSQLKEFTLQTRFKRAGK